MLYLIYKSVIIICKLWEYLGEVCKDMKWEVPMKLKGKLLLSSVIICIISVVSLSIINYSLSITRLKEAENQRVQL